MQHTKHHTSKHNVTYRFVTLPVWSAVAEIRILRVLSDFVVRHLPCDCSSLACIRVVGTLKCFIDDGNNGDYDDDDVDVSLQRCLQYSAAEINHNLATTTAKPPNQVR